MTSIVLAALASALVVFAILVKARAAKPTRAEKWEKAQIVKRLLALSERENTAKRISTQSTLSQSPTSRRQASAARDPHQF